MVEGYGDLTAEQQTFYNKSLLERPMPDLPHTLFGLKFKIPRNGGATANWRRFERPTASTTALTENSSGAVTTISVSAIAASIFQYGMWAEGTDLAQDQSIDNVVDGFTDVLREDMAIAADTIARNAITAGTTVQYASTAGSRGGVATGMLLTAGEVLLARRTLRNNNARALPEAGNKLAAIFSMDTEMDWLRDPTYTNAVVNAGVRGESNPIFDGGLLPYWGIAFFPTSNARVFVTSGAGNVNVACTLIMGKGFYGITELDAQQAQMIFKDRGSAGTLDPLNQRWTIGRDLLVADLKPLLITGKV